MMVRRGFPLASLAVFVSLAACSSGGSSGAGGGSASSGNGVDHSSAGSTSGSGGDATSGSGGGSASSTSSATTGPGATTGSGGAGGSGGVGSGGAGGAGGSGGGKTCPQGVTCVTSFPFHDQRDTSVEGQDLISSYSCKPTADESGPEIVYRVTVPEAGFLSAAVYSDTGVDIDVHILSALDGAACLDRGDLQARADVPAGDVWIVADTYVSNGVEKSGGYQIDIGFIVPSQGACDMQSGTLPRVNDGGNSLAMPATGPIVKEAHLVTAGEPAPYPMTDTDELKAHYALSQKTTGLVMYRDQVWAPEEGGGTFYGEGIGSPANFPTLDEGWYVNMYWKTAPARGTRMILRQPGGNRAVVVAAGYETGPGELDHIGGTPEESHFYMKTNHLDTMQLGFATDQTLPLGPRICQ